MAGVGQSWIKPLALAVLLAGAWALVFAQLAHAQSSPAQPTPSGSSGSLSGRLTDLHSRPMDSATVVMRNQATGAETRTITAKNGTYRFSALEPGEYTLEAESPQLGRGQVEDIVVDAGHEARVQAALEFKPLTPSANLAALVETKLLDAKRADLARVEIVPVSIPANSVDWAFEAPQTLPMAGRRLVDVLGGLPAVAAPVVRVTLPAQPLRMLALAGQKLPDSIRPAPAASRALKNEIARQVPQQQSSRTESYVEWTEQVVSGTAKAAEGAEQVAAETEPSAKEPSPVSGRDFSRAISAPISPRTLVLAGCFSANSVDNNSSTKGRETRVDSACTEAGAAAPQALSWTLARGRGMAVAEAAARAAQATLRQVQTAQSPVLAAPRDRDPASPADSSSLSAAELQALPISGRRWQDFVLDNAPRAAGGQGQSSQQGLGQTAEIAIDGMSKGLAFRPSGGTAHDSPGSGSVGQGAQEPAGMAQAWAGGRGAAISEAAIRAVETEAGNVQSEAFRGARGRTNVETQRGADGLHGQGFLYDRQNVWGAPNPFTQWVKETTPATDTAIPVFTPESYTPPDHETTWGLGLGSRIRREKLFWFAAVDSYQRNDPGLSTVKRPDEFFAQPSYDQMQVLGARLGLSSANPVGVGLAAYSPLLETLGGLLGPAPRTATQWTGFGRLDWEEAERHRFTLEGIGARWDSPGGGLTRVAETFGNHSFGSSRASEEWMLGRWEAFLTPNLLAVTQASAGRTIEQARAETPSDFEQKFLAGNVWGQLPQMVVDSRYGFTIGNPSRFGTGSYPDEHLYQGQESVDWVRGIFLVKAGFDAGRNDDAISLLRNRTGTYYYSSVENFASDALAFDKFGMSGQLQDMHNCDQTGKVWRDSGGSLRGAGNLPCYSYYSQAMGPAGWRLSTNDWAGYLNVQLQASKRLTVSFGLRWEREQLPPPIATLRNPELPLTEKSPSPGNNWGPRLALALGSGESHLPVLRLGYGMYFGRAQNAAVATALTHTGSLNGDLNFFLRPTDGYNSPTGTGSAPPFPYVLAGTPASVVKPGAVEFAPGFRNPEIHQAVAAVEEALPGRLLVTASAVASLGRRLPVSIDTNFDPTANPGTITYGVVDGTGLGPIKATQITVPFYASWPSSTSSTGFAGRLNPDYQQISQVMSRSNSTYEAATLRVVRYGRHGLTLHAHYTYAHAMDWNPNETSQVAGNDVLDPADFSREYGTSDLDIRHAATAMVIWEPAWKLGGAAGRLANGWMLSSVGQFRSGMPYTMRTGGSLAKEFDSSSTAIVGLAPGMNGSGGDTRVYGLGNDNRIYNIGRNTYRYPTTWKADLRVGRRFNLGQMRQLELLAESFNLFNHQNVTELETTGYYLESGSQDGTLPTLNFLTGLKANTTAFGQPLNVNATNFYRERQIQFGLRVRF
jgi:hypothetical protein